ncbi:MAG: hypothetical protein JJV96_00075 [Alphaproteobacteria bacterium]|nr:hypothetical protein [Alphaproteobacteria bacterium]
MKKSPQLFYQLLAWSIDGISIASMIQIDKKLPADQYKGKVLIADVCNLLIQSIADKKFYTLVEKEFISSQWKTIGESFEDIVSFLNEYVKQNDITPSFKDLSQMNEEEMQQFLGVEKIIKKVKSNNSKKVIEDIKEKVVEKKVSVKSQKIVMIIFFLMFLTSCQHLQYKSPESEYIEERDVVFQDILTENSVPIYQKNPIVTTKTVQMFSSEWNYRCSIEDKTKTLISTMPRPNIRLIPIGEGDPLPDFNIKDFSMENEKLEVGINRLLEGLDITVINNDDLSKDISIDQISGKLDTVIKTLAKLSNVYINYDKSKKIIKIKNEMEFIIESESKSIEVFLAFLDSIYGIQVPISSINWKNKNITTLIDRERENLIYRSLISINKADYLVAYDVNIYRLYPKSKEFFPWMDLIRAFGNDAVEGTSNGVLGKTLIMAPNITRDDFENFISLKANYASISQGTMFAYPDQQSKFNIGQCAKTDRLEKDLTIFTKTKFERQHLETDNIVFHTELVLYKQDGELASFKTTPVIGNSILIIGIPLHTFLKQDKTTLAPWNEVVLWIQPRLIQFIDPKYRK